MQPDKGNKKSHFGGNQWMRMAGIGTEMAAAIFICVYIGHRLDKYFQTSTPWITILTLFIGVSAAFYLVYKQLK